MRLPQHRSTLGQLLASLRPALRQDAQQARHLHAKPTTEYTLIPSPTPFVPNVTTFLTLIGRNMKDHASKFPTWEAFFSLQPAQLKQLGVEPSRDRRYMMTWRNRFRHGIFGAGGDLQHVSADGFAELKVVELPTEGRDYRKEVLNVPLGADILNWPAEELHKLPRPKGYAVVGAWGISGPYAQPLKSGGAKLAVTDGMWEDRRGRKVDGGERRQAEVRFRRRVAERKERREAEAHARM